MFIQNANTSMKNVILLFILLHGIYAYANTNLNPEVTTYNALDYGSHAKNWSIVSDSLGYLYCANQKGLLQFDGYNWEINQLPNNGIIRSVYIDNKGYIYTGSLEEFGYWVRDEFGKLRYTSLSAKIENFKFHNQEIWKIIEVDSCIYFHSFSDVFYYKENKLYYTNELAAPSFLMNIDNKVMCQLKTGEFISLNDGNISVINNEKNILGAELKTAVKMSNDNYLIGSGSKGLFLYKNKKLTSWNSEVNTILLNKQINKIIAHNDKYYIATNQHGLYISDKNGNVVDHIDSEDQLISNSIQDICFDKCQNLWLAHNGGISRINFNPSVQYITDEKTKIGAVYSATVHNNYLYLGTDIGVFKHPYSPSLNSVINLSNFELIEELIGQTWTLKVIDDQLFCGHANGTYIINESSTKQISNLEGGFCFKKAKIKGKDYILQGTYSGIVIFSQDPKGNWTQNLQLDNYTEPTKNIEVDFLGNIWATHYTKNGVFRLELSEDLATVDSVYIYNKSTFDTDKRVQIAELEGRVCFLSQNGLYAFNDLENRFQLLHTKNEQLKEFKNSDKVEHLGDSYAFFLKDKIGIFSRSTKELKPVIKLCIPHIAIVENSDGIINLNNNTLLICLENGIALVDKKQNTHTSYNSTNIVFREITATTDQLPIALDSKEKTKLSYKNNYISFHFSADNFNSQEVLFTYKLEGLDDNWSKESNLHFANYSRLPWGEYRFSVKAKDIFDNTIEEISYSFTVSPPYYASKIAYLFYIIIILSLAYATSIYNAKAVERERKKNLTKILELENENLKNDVKYKSKELASIMLGSIRKNEALVEITKLIEKQKKDIPEANYKSLLRAIKQKMSPKKDLEKFEAHFDNAYNNFFKKIKAEYPNLSSNDLRLCAYLRMNLSTKELASLMSISVRGLETHRYRLRKKFNLKPEDNLIEFILTLA